MSVKAPHTRQRRRGSPGGRRIETGPRWIVRLAAYHGLPAFHFKHGARCTCGRFCLVNPHLKGWPDVVVTLPGGRLLWIEWKGRAATEPGRSAEGCLSRDQRKVVADLRGLKHEVLVTGDMKEIHDRFEKESVRWKR